jgi:hypothetical protein
MRKEDWSRWYKKDYPHGPERCFVELKGQLPVHIKNVIDFGCAAGRNLEAFNGDYELFGVDLIPESEMEWRPGLRKLTYWQSRLQDFRIDRPLDDFLCISHGVIYYLNPVEQKQFLGYLIERGCTNFILQEYDRETLHHDGYAEPGLLSFISRRRFTGYPFSNPFNFEKRWFRKETPAWIRIGDGA